MEPNWEVDGSILEGGGQILRNSSALSCILGRGLQVTKVRAGRDRPGLRAQHLTGIKLLAHMTHAQLTHCDVGSTEFTLIPGSNFIKAGNYEADTKTAGSICLLIQSALPCLLFASGPCSLVLKGGTNAAAAPQVDYTQLVFLPMAKAFGFTASLEVTRRGFYPKGQGVVQLKTTPIKSLRPITLIDPGVVVRITGLAYVAGVVPIKVAHRSIKAAQSLISFTYADIPVDVKAVAVPPTEAVGNGAGIILIAETSTGCLIAGSALGEKGVPAEKVGESAASMLISNLLAGGCVDEYLQDQLIIFMALAAGKSSVLCGPLTLHTETAIHIAKTLTGAKFTVSAKGEKGPWLIECEGVGFYNHHLD